MATATIEGTAPFWRLVAIDDAMAPAIERLLDLAFGSDRRHRTAYRLRAGTAFDPALSVAAIAADGTLVGSLQTWPLALDDDALWLVGPIAVDPDLRGRGIARAMIAHALAGVDETPWPAVLIGDPAYYAPFGFSAAATGGWRLPGPVERHRLLARVASGVALPRDGSLGPWGAAAAKKP